jgi:Domain of unknown function (DUF4129)
MARRRTLIFVAALVGLVALVAVASRGHSPTGGGATHAINWRIIWEFVLIGFFALFIISLPLAVWTIYSTRTDDPMRATKRRKRSIFRMWMIAGIALGVLLYWWIRRHYFNSARLPHIVVPSLSKSNQQLRTEAKPLPFDWAPAIIIISIAVVASVVVAYLMFREPRRKAPTRAEIAAKLSSLLDDSLDDLRAERDPRKAVIATYARMERTLAGFGFPRAEAEAPREYLVRVLRDLLEASADAVSRLTSLFERAKFSTHDIDPWMKNDAIASLVEMRDELRAAVPT